MQPGSRITYVPTSQGWVQASGFHGQPFHSQPPPVPVGVNYEVWHIGNWWENSAHREAPIQSQKMWLPHPAWYSQNPGVGPSAVDIERVQWLWAPRGVDVHDLVDHQAPRSRGQPQTPQTEDSLPPSLPASPTFDFARMHATERVRNGRDTPHPCPGQLPTMDDNYGPYRINASPRAANISFQRHAHRAPQPTMSPPVISTPAIPSSSSHHHHHPPHNHPPGSSSYTRAPENPSSSSFPPLPLLHNPLPPPPKHIPLAQELLRRAKQSTVSDARNR